MVLSSPFPSSLGCPDHLCSFYPRGFFSICLTWHWWGMKVTLISGGHMGPVGRVQDHLMENLDCQTSCNNSFKKYSLAISKSQQLAGDKRYFSFCLDETTREGRGGGGEKCLAEMLFLYLLMDAVGWNKSECGLPLQRNAQAAEWHRLVTKAPFSAITSNSRQYKLIYQ